MSRINSSVLGLSCGQEMSAPVEDGSHTRMLAEEWRQHWRVGVASFFGMAVGAAVLPSIFSLFILPLQNAFGWSRGQIGLANYALMVPALLSPMAGRWIDRVGARVPLLISTTLAALAYLMLGMMSGSLPVFYALYGFLAIAGMLTTGLTYARVICVSFVKTRGVSLAIGRSGMSVSATLLPIALFAIISEFGWRAGYFLMAGLILGIALPMVFFWIRGKAGSPGTGDMAQPSTPFLKLLTDRTVVTIAGSAALAYLPLMSVLSQSVPLLVDKGMTPGFAASTVGVVGVASFTGALFTGYLLDRFWAPAVAATMLTLGAIGCLILAYGAASPTVGIIGIIAIGVSFGAEVDVLAYAIARYCGLSRYSSVMGLCSTVLAVAVGAGSSGIGLLYDHFGNYRVALTMGSICFLLSAAGYLSLGRYPADEPQ